MKHLVLFILGFFIASNSLMADESTDKDQLYTGFNIWVLSKQQSHNQRFINYKHGTNILPAGTAIYNVQALSSAPSGGMFGSEESEFPGPHVYFETADGKSFEILFKSKWHPGKTLEDYKNYLATTKTFDELTDGFSKEEVEAIRKGIVVIGMSKSAVLVSYGRPAEHRTPSLDSSRWLYWTGRTSMKTICFDTDDKAVRCAAGSNDDAL